MNLRKIILGLSISSLMIMATGCSKESCQTNSAVLTELSDACTSQSGSTGCGGTGCAEKNGACAFDADAVKNAGNCASFSDKNSCQKTIDSRNICEWK